MRRCVSSRRGVPQRCGAASDAIGRVVLLVMVLIGAAPVLAQTDGEPFVAPPEQAVAVEPAARDEAIETRISRILKATGWFRELAVAVDEGIVFLDGVTTDEDHREWAREVASRTEDVVAVVNRVAVREEVTWERSKPHRPPLEFAVRVEGGIRC